MGGTTAWILGDQLQADHPALDGADRVVLVESGSRLRRRPQHRRKLVLLLSAMRHRAEELDADGTEVELLRTERTIDALAAHVERHRPDRVVTARAAEWRGRRFQARLEERLGVPVEIVPDTRFLVERHDPVPDASGRVVMERFYRAMRSHFGLLVEDDGEPAGGRWNFDTENRKPYPAAGLEPPPVPAFSPDEVTRTVMEEVRSMPGIGEVDGFDLPVTRNDASRALSAFVDARLGAFGPYEDAMSSDHDHLYHSLLSPVLNLGLLDPLETARAAERAYRAGDVPIESAEGFVRQIVGWREYVYWSYHRLMPGLATANAWEHRRPLPSFWWTGETDMRCLGHVIGRVLATGYCHHIERLMVLCNFAMLAGVDPVEVNEWFLSCFVDAYEWVVTPNVVGMGLNADGGIVATKPYVASASYIGRMSDYCDGCRYDRRARTGEDACPFNTLYWDFLIRNEERLRSNPRSGKAVLGLRHLDQPEREAVGRRAARLRDSLGG